MFEAGELVDVTGTSKGKGFAGTVKRHNFRMQDATHGNSLAHRAPGSIGQCQTPGRVFKGTRMAGRMGGERVTVQNLEVVVVDADKHLLAVRGSVPGAKGGILLIKPSRKSRHQRMFDLTLFIVAVTVAAVVALAIVICWVGVSSAVSATSTVP